MTKAVTAIVIIPFLDLAKARTEAPIPFPPPLFVPDGGRLVFLSFEVAAAIFGADSVLCAVGAGFADAALAFLVAVPAVGLADAAEEVAVFGAAVEDAGLAVCEFTAVLDEDAAGLAAAVVVVFAVLDVAALVEVFELAEGAEEAVLAAVLDVPADVVFAWEAVDDLTEGADLVVFAVGF